MKLRRIIIDYAALAEWIREHVKDAPSDLTVHRLQESIEYTVEVPGDDGIKTIYCGEVLVKSDSFTYIPDGTAPVTWRPVVKRCAGCLST